MMRHTTLVHLISFLKFPLPITGWGRNSLREHTLFTEHTVTLVVRSQHGGRQPTGSGRFWRQATQLTRQPHQASAQFQFVICPRRLASGLCGPSCCR
uniref:Putative secreted protein n=1 Tax=Anopheles marajoara TaxID=58244 RepID=A0A2M4C961_9DIPT